MIYHITSAYLAEEARKSGEYAPETFDVDGIIHCSYARQLKRVADNLFRGHKDLVVLEVDPTKLDCDVVDENLEGGEELFPHIYGTVPISAIVAVHDFPCRKDGTFDVPSSVSA